MQSNSDQSGRAMGLVKAAHSSWKHSEGSAEETKELRQDYEARLTELATHGLQIGRNLRRPRLCTGAGGRRGVRG
jgi:hypothetical protein